MCLKTFERELWWNYGTTVPVHLIDLSVHRYVQMYSTLRDSFGFVKQALAGGRQHVAALRWIIVCPTAHNTSCALHYGDQGGDVVDL